MQSQEIDWCIASGASDEHRSAEEGQLRARPAVQGCGACLLRLSLPHFQGDRHRDRAISHCISILLADCLPRFLQITLSKSVYLTRGHSITGFSVPSLPDTQSTGAIFSHCSSVSSDISLALSCLLVMAYYPAKGEQNSREVMTPLL